MGIFQQRPLGCRFSFHFFDFGQILQGGLTQSGVFALGRLEKKGLRFSGMPRACKSHAAINLEALSIFQRVSLEEFLKSGTDSLNLPASTRAQAYRESNSKAKSSCSG
jgi:hypothetical protein